MSDLETGAREKVHREVPFGRPMIGAREKAAVAEVLAGHMLTHGPRVKAFEQAFAAYVGGGTAVAMASCTAALHLAYVYLGMGPGDEVLVPAQTHIATAHAVELCGGTSVFVDAEPQTGNMDLDLVEALITPRTRAISVVHYLGMPIDMGRVLALARKHGLFVVEDCALSLGATYQGTHTGLMGDVGCFSFYPVKHMTTAEGGMLLTRRPEVAKDTAILRAFGIDRNVVHERKVPGQYDAQALGYNYRMNELSAALGLVQLERMPDFLAKRKQNFEALWAGLADVDTLTLLPGQSAGVQNSYYCLSAMLKPPLAKRRTEVMMALKARGVGTSIYYPRPVPLMTYYQKRYGKSAVDFPVASQISDHSIALPVGPHLDVDDVAYMVDNIKEVLWQIKTS